MKTTLLRLLQEIRIDLTNTIIIPQGGSYYIENIFELMPKDFLRFAKMDFKLKDDRGIINSLTNAKRAIDCQVDEIFEKCGITINDFDYEIKEFIKLFELDDDIPLKLKFIHALNLAPSNLISKTRNIRNKLEHSYRKPTISEAKEALDLDNDTDESFLFNSVISRLKSSQSDQE